jgi:virginiamycin A acetyltransferase
MNRRFILQFLFSLIGAISGIISIGQKKGKTYYVRYRYKEVSFGDDCNADEFCSFEKYVRIGFNVLLSKVNIGSYTYIGSGSIIKNCTIGRFCSIAPEVRIGLGIHPVRESISTYPGFYSGKAAYSTSLRVEESFKEYQEVIIGNDVWIGARTMIRDGVKIGNGAVVGAGAVVTRDVEPYCIVVGVPARIVGQRFSNENISKLQTYCWWDKDIDYLKSISHLFMRPNDFFIFLK